ncbi:MAG: lactonase family protein [Chromatiales bacterium]|nr:lactonase family protein [Chromatiales bacterium]
MFKLICLPTILLMTAAEAFAFEYLVYVGTYTGKGSEGIYAYRFDPATGETSSVGLAAATDNPSFLAVDPNGRFLYAVNELDTFRNEPTGAVSVFAIDRESGTLKLLQQVPSLGEGPAHVSLDKSARYLMVANYNGGNVAVFPIGNDGRLGRHSAFVQDAGSSVNPERQAGPHAHSIQVTPDNRFAIAADLGLDKLLVYRFDANTGSLTPGSPGFVEVDPGAGPRHVAFAPSGKFVYVVNEMASTVTVFAYQPGPGTLHRIQTIPTLPKNFSGKNTAAEIVVDAKGRFLYVSNRGHDSIAVFGIDPDNGNLTVSRVGPRVEARRPATSLLTRRVNGCSPPTRTQTISRLFQIDQKSGRLTPAYRSLTVVSPVCVRIVSFK